MTEEAKRERKPRAGDAVESYLEEGDISRLNALLHDRAARSVFLVYDRDAYGVCGAEAKVEPQLDDFAVSRFAEFTPNPQLEEIRAGVERYGESSCDAIVGIGGGSALDVAKMIAIFAGNRHAPAERIVRGEVSIERPGPPVIAIPTTSGTGSQATHFSALYLDGVKYSVSHPFVLPAVAIVDPELTYSMPAAITAATGLDALCQAVESMWAVGSTEESLGCAEEALRLAVGHLAKAVCDPCPASRRGMAMAAHLAGKAIDISKTTASHALSYTFTSDYGVPHGMAVALTLGAMLEYNAGVTAEDCVDPRGPGHVRDAIARALRAMQCDTPKSGRAWVARLLEALDCPTRLSDVGVQTPAERAAVAAKCNAERMGNNPRRLDRSILERLLQEIA